MNDDTRNVILKGVQLWWPKLVRPVAPFGEDLYEVQLRVPAKRKAELEEFGKTRTVDDAPGMVVLNVRKKATKVDGSPSRKPIVVTGNMSPLDPDTIGNGSIGNVRLRLNDYEIKHPKTGKVTKTGTKAVLEAVQVTKLLKFERTGGDGMSDFDEEDFEEVESDATDEAPAKKPAGKPAAKPASKKPAQQDFEEEEEETEEEEAEEPAKPAKKVNAGLAKFQAEQAAKKAAAAKKPTFKSSAKKPVSKGRNSDY